jgi:hypothetical protein
MIKILYDGYMVRDMYNNYHSYPPVGRTPEPVKEYFYLYDDDIERLNDFGSVKIRAVIGERLDEYDMLIYENGDDLPLVQYSGLLTDRTGEETPFEIIKGKNTYSQDNGNQLKIFFDDEEPQTNPENSINVSTDNLEQQSNQTKPRKKLKPFEREISEGMLLIYEIINYRKVQYLDELSAKKAWNLIVSGNFKSDLTKSIADDKESIMLNNQRTFEKSDFLRKYNSRFIKTLEAI